MAGHEIAQELYLDLMKKCITNSIYRGDIDLSRGKVFRNRKSDKLRCSGVFPTEQEKYDGVIWPSIAHTMIGMRRLNNLQSCVEDILKSGVPSDLIETGVWRGGACIFMRAILKCYCIKDRRVWVADSFKGLPIPDTKNWLQDSKTKLHLFEVLDVSLEEVRDNFKRYGLLDEQVVFLEGWFRDTLPKAPIEALALLRTDCDMYESTMESLTNLYPKLSEGGYIIVDDYATQKNCRLAVDNFRLEHHIKEKMHEIDSCGVYWKKERKT